MDEYHNKTAETSTAGRFRNQSFPVLCPENVQARRGRRSSGKLMRFGLRRSSLAS
jgi:hypothetical protein